MLNASHISYYYCSLICLGTVETGEIYRERRKRGQGGAREGKEDRRRREGEGERVREKE